jgi:hypothetical protein
VPDLQNNGIDFERIIASDYYVNERDEHVVSTSTAWSPLIPIYERIVAMFPTLSFIDFHISDEMGNFFYKGAISAAGTDIVRDEEAERESVLIRSGVVAS